MFGYSVCVSNYASCDDKIQEKQSINFDRIHPIKLYNRCFVIVFSKNHICHAQLNASRRASGLVQYHLKYQKGSMLMLFIKRHKFLSVFFAVCILLMIKNSSIPYFFTPSSFIALLFDKPRTEFFLGVAQLVDIFASAYVTSLLFYYMVDFLPTVKKEEKAKKIVNKNLANIYLYISQFLAMIEYAAKQANLLPTSATKSLDNFTFRDEIIYCKQITLENEIENGTIPYSYNLLKLPTPQIGFAP